MKLQTYNQTNIMDSLKSLSERLRKCGYKVEIFKSGRDASKRLYETVNGHTVGTGSSMTLDKLGIKTTLKNYAKKVYPHIPGDTGNDDRMALTADYYLCSANAISMNGHIVNIDGKGNRVAATCFGPKHVIYLIGKNKITDTLEDALDRAKETAVQLAKYYNRKTPCVKTGQCSECLSKESICAITTIHRKKPYGIDISVYLIDEEIGL